MSGFAVKSTSGQPLVEPSLNGCRCHGCQRECVGLTTCFTHFLSDQFVGVRPDTIEDIAYQKSNHSLISSLRAVA
jgi:hypothetical protein